MTTTTRHQIGPTLEVNVETMAALTRIGASAAQAARSYQAAVESLSAAMSFPAAENTRRAMASLAQACPCPDELRRPGKHPAQVRAEARQAAGLRGVGGFDRRGRRR